jgi:hypothetical protein
MALDMQLTCDQKFLFFFDYDMIPNVEKSTASKCLTHILISAPAVHANDRRPADHDGSITVCIGTRERPKGMIEKFFA